MSTGFKNMKIFVIIVQGKNETTHVFEKIQELNITNSPLVEDNRYDIPLLEINSEVSFTSLKRTSIFSAKDAKKFNKILNRAKKIMKKTRRKRK